MEDLEVITVISFVIRVKLREGGKEPAVCLENNSNNPQAEGEEETSSVLPNTLFITEILRTEF